jgi:hypothetical protein
MSLGGFTLADRLGARSVPCRVSGCTRTWIQLGGKSLALGKSSGASPDDPAAGMCEPCKKKFASLHDKQRRCDVPGCQHTWTWSAAAQLEAFAAHKPPPRHLCGSCEGKLAALEDKQIACSVPGCTRTGTLTRRQQLLAETAQQADTQAEATDAEAHVHEAEAPAAEPTETLQASETPAEPAAEASAPAAEAGTAETTAAGAGGARTEAGERRNGDRQERAEKPGKVTITGPMCAPCSDVARRLTDRPVHCGINGCKRKWVWKADDQLLAFAAGKPNEPPRRMCETSPANFGKLLDREVRCRTSGCKKTWTWWRFDQLDACVADKPAPKAPARMCESCFDSFAKLKDVERPCRKAGCKRTWTDKRGAQLARLVRGRTGDPYPQYCVECQKELGDLEDREITCKTEGCSGTWTWSREQQLAAGVRPMPKAQLEEEAGKPEAQAATAPKLEPAADAAAEGAAAEGVLTAETSAAEAALPAGEAGAETSATGEVAGGAENAAPAEGVPAAVTGVPSAAHGERGRRGGRGGRNRRRKQRQIQPPERLCHACAEFLKDKKTLEIPCQQCGTPIYWPPESQLQTHLGNWATPAMCGACKRDATEAARLVAKEAIRHQMELTAHPGGEAPAPTAPSTEAPTSPGTTETN